MKLSTVERLIINDPKGVFTLLAVASAIATLVNSFTASSVALGVLFSFAYLFVNSVLLGHLLFREEVLGFRVAFGVLILITLVSLGNAIAMLIVALELLPLVFDARTVAFVLILITGAISGANHSSRRAKPRTNSAESTSETPQ